MSENYLAEKELSVTVTDSDDDYDTVIGKLFNKVRKQVFEELQRPVIQMETKEFYIEDSKVLRTTKGGQITKYFMPGEKVNYTITARVVVAVKYINLSKEEII